MVKRIEASCRVEKLSGEVLLTGVWEGRYGNRSGSRSARVAGGHLNEEGQGKRSVFVHSH